MKELSEYVTKMPFKVKQNFLLPLLNDLDNKPLTKAERKAEGEKADKLATEQHTEWKRRYCEDIRRLEKEFFADCRAEYGYGEFLTEEGCEKLESMAWVEGHASGFVGVLGYVQIFAEFVESIIDHINSELKKGF